MQSPTSQTDTNNRQQSQQSNPQNIYIVVMDETNTRPGAKQSSKTGDAAELQQTSQQVKIGQAEGSKEKLARVTSNRMNLSPPRFTDGTELQSCSERGLEMAIAGEQIVPQQFPHKEGFSLLAHKAAAGPAKSTSRNKDLAHIELSAAQDAGGPPSPQQIQIRSTAEREIDRGLKGSSRNLNEKQDAGMEKQNSTLIAVNSQFPESDSLHGLGPQSMLSNQLLNQFSLLKIDSLQNSTFNQFVNQEGELQNVGSDYRLFQVPHVAITEDSEDYPDSPVRRQYAQSEAPNVRGFQNKIIYARHPDQFLVSKSNLGGSDDIQEQLLNQNCLSPQSSAGSMFIHNDLEKKLTHIANFKYQINKRQVVQNLEHFQHQLEVTGMQGLLGLTPMFRKGKSPDPKKMQTINKDYSQLAYQRHRINQFQFGKHLLEDVVTSKVMPIHEMQKMDLKTKHEEEKKTKKQMKNTDINQGAYKLNVTSADEGEKDYEQEDKQPKKAFQTFTKKKFSMQTNMQNLVEKSPKRVRIPVISRTVTSDVKEEQPVVQPAMSPEKKAPSKTHTMKLLEDLNVNDQTSAHVNQVKQNSSATKHLLTPMPTSPKSTGLNQVKIQGTIQINQKPIFSSNFNLQSEANLNDAAVLKSNHGASPGSGGRTLEDPYQSVKEEANADEACSAKRQSPEQKRSIKKVLNQKRRSDIEDWGRDENSMDNTMFENMHQEGQKKKVEDNKSHGDESKQNSTRLSAIQISKSEMMIQAQHRPPLVGGKSVSTDVKVEGANTTKKDRADLKTEQTSLDISKAELGNDSHAVHLDPKISHSRLSGKVQMKQGSQLSSPAKNTSFYSNDMLRQPTNDKVNSAIQLDEPVPNAESKLETQNDKDSLSAKNKGKRIFKLPLSNNASDFEYSPRGKQANSPTGEYHSTKFGAKHFENRSPFNTKMIHYSEINYQDQAKQDEIKFRQTTKNALKGRLDPANSTDYYEKGGKKLAQTIQLKDRPGQINRKQFARADQDDDSYENDPSNRLLQTLTPKLGLDQTQYDSKQEFFSRTNLQLANADGFRPNPDSAMQVRVDPQAIKVSLTNKQGITLPQFFLGGSLKKSKNSNQKMYVNSSEDNDSIKSYEQMLSGREGSEPQKMKQDHINVGLKYDHRAWNKLKMVPGRKSPTSSQYGQFQMSATKFKTMNLDQQFKSELGAYALENKEKQKEQTESLIDKVKQLKEQEMQEIQKKLEILNKSGQLGRYRRFKMSSELSNTLPAAVKVPQSKSRMMSLRVHEEADQRCSLFGKQMTLQSAGQSPKSNTNAKNSNNASGEQSPRSTTFTKNQANTSAISENKNDFTFDEKIKGNNSRKSKLKGGKNVSKKTVKGKAQPRKPENENSDLKQGSNENIKLDDICEAVKTVEQQNQKIENMIHITEETGEKHNSSQRTMSKFDDYAQQIQSALLHNESGIIALEKQIGTESMRNVSENRREQAFLNQQIRNVSSFLSRLDHGMRKYPTPNAGGDYAVQKSQGHIAKERVSRTFLNTTLQHHSNQFDLSPEEQMMKKTGEITLPSNLDKPTVPSLQQTFRVLHQSPGHMMKKTRNAAPQSLNQTAADFQSLAKMLSGPRKQQPMPFRRAPRQNYRSRSTMVPPRRGLEPCRWQRQQEEYLFEKWLKIEHKLHGQAPNLAIGTDSIVQSHGYQPQPVFLQGSADTSSDGCRLPDIMLKQQPVSPDPIREEPTSARAKAQASLASTFMIDNIIKSDMQAGESTMELVTPAIPATPLVDRKLGSTVDMYDRSGTIQEIKEESTTPASISLAQKSIHVVLPEPTGSGKGSQNATHSKHGLNQVETQKTMPNNSDLVHEFSSRHFASGDSLNYEQNQIFYHNLNLLHEQTSHFNWKQKMQFSNSRVQDATHHEKSGSTIKDLATMPINLQQILQERSPHQSGTLCLSGIYSGQHSTQHRSGEIQFLPDPYYSGQSSLRVEKKGLLQSLPYVDQHIQIKDISQMKSNKLLY